MCLVDDLLVASNDVKDTTSLYEGLLKKYKLTSKEEITEILNMKVERNAERLTIYQERYINEKVRKFNLETSKDETIPLSEGFDVSNEEEIERDVPYLELIG